MPKKSAPIWILDAWAILALLQSEEPAASRVLAVLDQAEQKAATLHMSWINLGEVYYRIGKQRSIVEAKETIEEIRLLPIRLHEANKGQILAAANIKAMHTLSYADAFAVTLAQQVGGTLLTGDPEIIRLAGAFSIEQLKRH